MAQRMLNVTEAKRDFLQLVRDVAAGDGPIVLLRNGKPVAQLCGTETSAMLPQEAREAFDHRTGRPAERLAKPTAYGIFADSADSDKRALEKDAWRKACEVKHACSA